MIGNHREKKLLVNLLNYIEPNVKLAIELMSKHSINFQEIDYFLDWLEICSIDGEKSPEFCYQYGLFLKNKDKKTSEEWLAKASKMGNKNARKELKSDEVIEIPVKGYTITMQRIDSEIGDFYIAKTPIPNSLFVALKCSYNTRYIENVSYRKRSICDDFLNKISQETTYKWQYPTINQWTLANSKKKLIDIHPTDGEWCIETTLSTYPSLKKKYRVAGYKNDDWLYENDMSYLRPVLNISQNPKLQ